MRWLGLDAPGNLGGPELATWARGLSFHICAMGELQTFSSSRRMVASTEGRSRGWCLAVQIRADGVVPEEATGVSDGRRGLVTPAGQCSAPSLRVPCPGWGEAALSCTSKEQ